MYVITLFYSIPKSFTVKFIKMLWRELREAGTNISNTRDATFRTLISATEAAGQKPQSREKSEISSGHP